MMVRRKTRTKPRLYFVEPDVVGKLKLSLSMRFWPPPPNRFVRAWKKAIFYAVLADIEMMRNGKDKV